MTVNRPRLLEPSAHCVCLLLGLGLLSSYLWSQEIEIPEEFLQSEPPPLDTSEFQFGDVSGAEAGPDYPLENSVDEFASESGTEEES